MEHARWTSKYGAREQKILLSSSETEPEEVQQANDGRVQLTTHQFRRQLLSPSPLQITKRAVTLSCVHVHTNEEITEAVEVVRSL